jgi:polar amino acid transport system substrate-binding protein
MAFLTFALGSMRDRLGRRFRANMWPCLLSATIVLAIGAWAIGREAGASALLHQGAFAHAQQRGQLIVGVPYVTPEAKAGAKIRTEERLDTALAQQLGQELQLPVHIVQIDPQQHEAALADGRVDVLLIDREVTDSHRRKKDHPAEISTGYLARPKAVIRNDTTLRGWEDVKGLTVCMSQAAYQAQRLAEKQQVVVRTYAVPSDALVAVREGQCDIGLIDDVMWTPLMAYPEWKSFSSTLKASGPQVERVWVTNNDDVSTQTWLAKTMGQWQRNGVIPAMTKKWARDIAFDVYLDQEVPDCHTGLP